MGFSGSPFAGITTGEPTGPSARTSATLGNRIETVFPPPAERAMSTRRPAPFTSAETTRACATGVESSGAEDTQRVRPLYGSTDFSQRPGKLSGNGACLVATAQLAVRLEASRK